jgi:trehalose 6-phosphate phosphatase
MASREQIEERLAQAERLWLFLDYDGTLADLATTPDEVTPDPEIVSLVSRLAQEARILVAVVSGRRLSHVQTLVPVPGIVLAGTYGLELQLANGQRLDRANLADVHPLLTSLKPRWEALIAGRDGFFLEDKTWALALHARFAAEGEAEQVLAAARRMAGEVIAQAATGQFRILGGHKFLEIGPRLAHKGQAVAFLLQRYPLSGAMPLYLGDDDKDEEAFDVVQAQGGIAILVAAEPRDTSADFRLESPQVARQWLAALPSRLAG